MSLLLQKTFPNGATGEYWKIEKAVQDNIRKRLDITICCFKDASYKNGQPVGAESYVFYNDVFADGPYPEQELLAGNSVAVGYNLIKQLDYFTGAQDI